MSCALSLKISAAFPSPGNLTRALSDSGERNPAGGFTAEKRRNGRDTSELSAAPAAMSSSSSLAVAAACVVIVVVTASCTLLAGQRTLLMPHVTPRICRVPRVEIIVQTIDDEVPFVHPSGTDDGQVRARAGACVCVCVRATQRSRRTHRCIDERGKEGTTRVS